MTCIVAIKNSDGSIVMGGDSAGVGGKDITIRKDKKVFINDEFIIGFTSSFRMGQLLQYSFIPPVHDESIPLDKYMVTVWIDAIRACFEKGGYLTKKENLEQGGTFLVGYKGRLFKIDTDFQVGEGLDDYDAVGCGEYYATGAMFGIIDQNISTEKKVEIALSAATKYSTGVRPPFNILKKTW